MMFDDLFDLVDVVCDAKFTDSCERRWGPAAHDIGTFTFTFGDPLTCGETHSSGLTTINDGWSAMINYATPMKPTKCVLSPPATILFWPDKTKTVVKCQNGDPWDPEKGIALAMLKKYFGNTGKYNDIIRDLIPNEK